MDAAMKKILLILFTSTLFMTVLHAQDADSLKIRPVSLGVLVLSAYPGFGAEIGGFIDYHMTKRLMIEVQAIVCLQNGSYVSTDRDLGFLFWHKRPVNYLADMRLVGMDIPIFFTYAHPVGAGNFRIGAGFFTHITFAAWCPGDKDFITPYRRIIEIKESGKPRYALNDSHAGIGGHFGYEFPCGLQINMSIKYSVLDIINYESKIDYAHPYKVTLGVGWHF